MFEAVILAGGKGTRLKSVTGDLPKPLVTINGEPFIYKLMKKLEKEGCQKIILSLGYRADFFKENVIQDRPVDTPIEFVIEESPLGTGGALKAAAKRVSDDYFVALNGDTFLDISYNEFAANSTNADLLISAVYVDDASRYGTLELDANNNVLAMLEKGALGRKIINSGTYLVNKHQLLKLKDKSFSFEEHFIKGFEGEFRAFVSDGYFIDIGIPEDYAKACGYFQ